MLVFVSSTKTAEFSSSSLWRKLIYFRQRKFSFSSWWTKKHWFQPLIGVFWAVISVCWIRGRIIRSVLYCSMYSNQKVGITHTQQQQQQLFYGPLSGTTRVSQYQKKHSPTHHHPIFISFFHLPRSIASSLFKLRAWHSFSTTSFHVLFGLPLGLEPSTSYSIHFFTHSVSSFHNTCPYHRNLFCCSINIISSIASF